MKSHQFLFSSPADISAATPQEFENSQLVLVFGARGLLTTPGLPESLSRKFPGAAIAGCSTCGEITRDGAVEDTLCVTAVLFQGGAVRVESQGLETGKDFDGGTSLARRLNSPGLRHLLILSEGLGISAQRLVDGILAEVGKDVLISGGLAGDGFDFKKTVLLSREGILDHHALGIGFYGENLQVSSASASGWIPFGRTRKVTRSQGNVVFEIDGAPALEVYSSYLGHEAKHLPASGLVYPIAIRTGMESGMIRSLSAVNFLQGSLSFFGEVPEGSFIQLMNASNKDLIHGARKAADEAVKGVSRPQLGFLFSCAGRKAVLKSHVDLEIAAVAQSMPPGVTLAGFHTYGEIGYFQGSGRCEHHNQTMTVTLMSEGSQSHE